MYIYCFEKLKFKFYILHPFLKTCIHNYVNNEGSSKVEDVVVHYLM